MKRNRKDSTGLSKFILLTLVIIVAGMTVAYAALSTTINIDGVARMAPASWNVKFMNLSAPALVGNASVKVAPILTDTMIGRYNVVLTKPGDSVTYTFDVVNSGDLDAELSVFTKDILPTCTGIANIPAIAENDAGMVCNNLSYTLTYTVGGSSVAQGDVLEVNQTKNLTLRLALSSALNEQPSNDVNITGLGISMIFTEL